MVVAALFALLAVVTRYANDLDASKGLAVPFAIGTVAVGLVAIVGQFLLMRRIDLTTAADEPELKQRYSSRFLSGLAVGEVPAILGLVGYLVSGNWVVSLVGSLFTIDATLRIRPSFSALVADQQLIDAAGSDLDLITALRRP